MDAILVTMPNDTYEFLNTMAVIQDYQVQLAVGHQRGQRDNYQVTFRIDEKFKYFERCLRVVHDNIPVFDYSGWDEEQRGEYDCFIRFDDNMFRRAKILADVMNSHITMGLNTLIGAGASPLPILAALQLKQYTSMVTDVLILDWDSTESSKLYNFILTNYPHLEIVLDPRDYSQYKVEEVVEYVNHFRCVIGHKGMCTYLATILKKMVLELFQTNEDGRLYGVSGTPNYWAAIGNKHTAEFLWTQWEEKLYPCLEYLLETKLQEEQTQEGLQVSTAAPVRGK